jgi:hypothetical protein
MIAMNGTNAAPTATRSSVMRRLSTVAPTAMRGTIRPSATAART